VPSEPLVIIPARLHSSRLPGKPLKKIGPKTLVEHARDSALEADIVPFITSDSMDVLNVVYPDHDHSFREVCLTSRDLETGTDRCAAFIEQTMGWDDAPEWIINCQGDMPFGTGPYLKRIISTFDLFSHADVITPVHRHEYVCAKGDEFKRAVTLEHIGIYAFRKQALRRFYEARTFTEVRETEKAENLEQCRCNALHMTVVACVIDDVLPPLEVNTQADLNRINEIVARCQPGAIGTQQARNLALASGG
jgi:3-deoxy-manno-octulosonate cytidylyltransferase (CMP-KDO synthetase)